MNRRCKDMEKSRSSEETVFLLMGQLLEGVVESNYLGIVMYKSDNDWLAIY